MKKCVTAVLAVLAVLLVVSLCACRRGAAEPQTAESVLGQMQEAMQATPCTEAVAQASLPFTMEWMDLELDLTLTLRENMTASADPATLHTVSAARLEIPALELTVPLDSETYVVPEGESLSRYWRTGTDWQKEAADVAAARIAADLPTENLTLDAEADLDGVPTFLVSGTLPGGALAERLSPLLGGANTDLAALSADVTLYIDAASFLPVYEEFVIRNIDAAVLALLRERMGEGEPAALGIHLTVGDMTLTRAFTSYEPQQAITMPKKTDKAS